MRCAFAIVHSDGQYAPEVVLDLMKPILEGKRISFRVREWPVAERCAVECHTRATFPIEC